MSTPCGGWPREVEGVNALVERKRLSNRASKQRDAEEKEWERLTLHKEAAISSLVALSENRRRAAAEAACARELRDHTSGFYEEIDKLAKGKAMLEVTDRVLEETNLIISDAKRIVGSDPYLRRTHEFVAAGNNPVYPDVLIALRSVLQSLDRFLAKKESEASLNSELLRELNTILAAIELLSEGEPPVSKEQLLRRMGQDPHQNWLTKVGFNDSRFDFEKLQSIGPPEVKVEQREKLALGSGE
jgi:hypothetical protein